MKISFYSLKVNLQFGSTVLLFQNLHHKPTIFTFSKILGHYFTFCEYFRFTIISFLLIKSEIDLTDLQLFAIKVSIKIKKTIGHSKPLATVTEFVRTTRKLSNETEFRVFSHAVSFDSSIITI